MSLDQEFAKTAEAVRKLTKQPPDHEFLETYALFKQATVGDVNTVRPSSQDAAGTVKWERWSTKKGMSKDAAKRAYVTYVNELMPKYK